MSNNGNRDNTAIKYFHKKALYLSTISILALSSSPVFAAEDGKDNSFALEEVVVTARKMEESLQYSPIAITAFSAQDMEDRSLTNLMELGSYTPNVTMSFTTGGDGGGSNSMIFIRGVGQTDFLFTTDPGVGTYIDGVYFARAVGGVFDLLDLEQVEILRGPQGTLFGKNTIGGAINMISKKPTGEFGGKASVTMGRFNRVDARGSMDFALKEDKLFAKVSFSSKNRDGYGQRLDYDTKKVVDTTGDENSTSARLALRWIASEKMEVNFIADYSREREKSTVRTLEFYDPGTPLAGLWNAFVGGPAGTPMTTDFVTGDPFTNYGTGPNRNNYDVWGLNLTIDYDFDNNIALKSITAYREMDAVFGRDGDNTPLSYVHTEDTQTQSQFSQEFQLSGVSADDKLNWIFGLFYFSEQGTDQNNVFLTSGLYDALEGLPGPINGSPLSAPTAPGGPGNPINIGLDLDFDINNAIDIESYAAFAQVAYDITDKLSLAVGARYSYEKKDYTLEHLRVNSGAAIVPLSTISNDWKSFSPKASFDYQWTEDFMTYASVSKGFKSGGFNGRPTTISSVESFDPETVLAYEVGFKSQWLENRVRFNAAAFFNDYTDIQLGSVSADDTGNLILIVQNAGQAEVKGFEAELQALITPEFAINGSVGYTDFTFTKLNDGVQDVTLSTQQPNTPEWSTSLDMTYTIPLANDGSLSIRGDWTYSSAVYRDVPNTVQLLQDGYSLFNARMTYYSADNWRLSVFGTNLSNKEYIAAGLSALASFGTVEAVYGRPREWGIELAVDF